MNWDNRLKTMTAIAVAHARTGGAKPRVHPNGFIQLDLASDGTRIASVRLHVWPDGVDIPKQSVATTIHDHRFDMDSVVLTGGLIQQTHCVRVDPSGFAGVGFTHEVHTAQYPAGRKESVLGPTGVKVYVAAEDRFTIPAGQSYVQPRYTFHDTSWYGLTATLMTKTGEDLEHSPRVLVPIGEEPDNSFVRADVDEALLWDYIERALAFAA